jgi:Flp pilus assembly protein TadD
VNAENNLAWLLSMRGDAADALNHAQHAAGLAPASPEVLDTLGVVLLQNGKRDEAVDFLRKAIAASSKVDPEYQFHLAQALAGIGKKDEAREILRASLQSDQPFKDKAEAQKLLAELGS